MAATEAIRFRVCVGPRSPLHAALATLPAGQRAAELLRLAQAGLRDPGGQGGRDSAAPPAPSDVADLAAAVRQLASAVKAVAAVGGAMPGGGGAAAPPGEAAERAARLDAAWGG